MLGSLDAGKLGGWEGEKVGENAEVGMRKAEI
jgi:hypothetical protein